MIHNGWLLPHVEDKVINVCIIILGATLTTHDHIKFFSHHLRFNDQPLSSGFSAVITVWDARRVHRAGREKWRHIDNIPIWSDDYVGYLLAWYSAIPGNMRIENRIHAILGDLLITNDLMKPNETTISGYRQIWCNMNGKK